MKYKVRSLLDEGSDRLQFAGHETFPCRYGWLKKSFDAVAGKGGSNVFAPDTAIADFGVGKNMAVSMKHWALALGIVATVRRRGRGAGITAMILAVLGPVVFFLLTSVLLGVGNGMAAVPPAG